MADATIWLFDDSGCDALPEDLDRWLSDSERSRSAGFALPARRRQFLIGRVLARQALGELLGIAPEAVVLDDRPGQAPRLCAPLAGANFSISHSGKWIACAVAAGVQVGLDIEARQVVRDFLASSEFAFQAETAARIGGLEGEARQQAFYAEWTALEAAIKLGAPVQAAYTPDHPELSVHLAAAQPLERAPRLRSVYSIAKSK